MCSRTADFQAACVKHREEKNQRVLRVIGKRLYIDGFVYLRNHVDRNGKVHWQCRRLQKKLCHARATTSDPAVSENIILFKGLEESKHSHAPSLADREEAEELERLDIEKKKSESPSADQTHENHVSDSNDETTSETESKESKSIGTVENVEIDGSVVSKSYSKRSEFSVAHDIDPNHGLDTAPKLISKKLHINRYTYTRTGSILGSKLYWECRRSTRYGCKARATTSNPSMGQKLEVHKGPDESSHNHPPILTDIEEDEKSVKCHWKRRKFKSRVNCKSEKQTTEKPDPAIAEFLKDFEGGNSSGGTHSVEKKSTSGSTGLCDETSSEMKPRIREFSIKAKKIGVDGQVADARLSRAPRSRKGKKSSYVTGLDYSQGPMPARLINSKSLQINGFRYFRDKANNDSSRYYWACKNYQTAYKCPARAVTSGFCSGQELIVYRGPNESVHNHRAPLAKVEESEEERPKLSSCLKNESKSNGSDLIVHRGVVDHISKPNQSQKSQKIDKLNETDLDTRERDSASEDDGISLNESSPRLIGKRLFIDGYIYSGKNYYDTCISWECRRQSLPEGKCSAKAITSNPSKDGALVVYDGPDVFKHNHSPSLAEVEEAKEYATLGLRQVKPNIRIDPQTFSETHELVKTQMVRRQCRSNLGRSSVDESESEAEISTSSKKRRKISVQRKHCASKRQGQLSDPLTYRGFLTRFLKQPTFDRKHVFQALRSIYKSDTGCIIGYAMVLENREKIERDLEALKLNPDVEIANLSGIRPIISSEDIEPDNNDSGIMRKGRIATADSSSTSDDETVPERSLKGETQQISSKSFNKQAESPKVPKLKKRVTFDEKTLNNEKFGNTNPERVSSLSTPSPCKNQIPCKPFVSITDSEDEVDVGEEIDGILYLPGKTGDKTDSQLGRPISADESCQNQMVTCSNVTDSEDEVDVGQEIDGILYLPGKIGDKANSQPGRSISANESCENQMVPGSNIMEVDPTNSMKNEENSPAAVSIKDLLVSKSSTDAMDLNKYVFTLKEEVPVIDLTDECNASDVKQECWSDEANIPQMSMQQLTYSPRNNSIDPLVLQSRQTSKSALLNPVCPANYVIPGIQTHTSNQFISSNMHGIRTDTNSQLSQYPGSSRLVHTPYLVSDLQVPILVNVPSTSNNGALHTDQLYAQIQVFRQPSSCNEFDGPKSSS